MRRAVVALLLLAGALVAPASSAAFDVEFENQCQYSYDRYWRPVPMVFGGRLTDGSGTELTPGAQLAVGDTVRYCGTAPCRPSSRRGSSRSPTSRG